MLTYETSIKRTKKAWMLWFLCIIIHLLRHTHTVFCKSKWEHSSSGAIIIFDMASSTSTLVLQNTYHLSEYSWTMLNYARNNTKKNVISMTMITLVHLQNKMHEILVAQSQTPIVHHVIQLNIQSMSIIRHKYTEWWMQIQRQFPITKATCTMTHNDHIILTQKRFVISWITPHQTFWMLM